MLRRVFLDWVIVGLICSAAVADEPAKEEGAKRGARILMVTQSAGYPHSSVTRKDSQLSPAERAITDLGISSGLFRVDCTQDVKKDFTKEKLQGYDIVYFYTTGKLPIDEGTLDYFINDWLKQKGHGFIGSHSATDTYNNDKIYYEMIGGTFNGHPWNAGTEITVTVHDTKHPASKPWGEEFTIKDEIYQFKHFEPKNVRVLMSMNMAKTKQKAAYHVPIAWVKEWGDGRVFYISLGHQEDVWTNPKYMESVKGGISWILRKEDGDATPNPDVTAAWDAKSKEDAGGKEGAKNTDKAKSRFRLYSEGREKPVEWDVDADSEIGKEAARLFAVLQGGGDREKWDGPKDLPIEPSHAFVKREDNRVQATIVVYEPDLLIAVDDKVFFRANESDRRSLRTFLDTLNRRFGD